ncbi:tRNA pseudouridine(55) synthase TruB [Anaeromyxobacter paludicola]|uniref:tRNA pseudouridine synthase B n=1 Tax=Anaeromyxobacter paludicola TaxID=2918171 RepID=A0ABM7X8Z7_9BACT|nr:tRNA pseudouridine(55) synthase TruB [Anaeromyxobacter paludicola]BDG08316.1 tRNA pseudouridine synthase B [Anaeromyxobacter paludicola]
MTTGVLVVDKPAGPTSFDVVRRVSRLFGREKAGHTGTLDPAATGVLGVCLGEAVKLQRFLMEGDKAYEALVAFGASTTTEDAEGELVEVRDPAGLDEARVRAALPAFVGELRQVPPMYSAVRVDGRRLHESARRGEEVAREPRTVRVDALELLGFEPPREGRAMARLRVACGKGTYVRTLAVDLGRALGLPAHLAALRRTAAGPFRLEQSIPLEEAERLGRETPAALAARLVPLEAALGFLPAVRLSEGEARDLRHGRLLPLPEVPPGYSVALGPGGEVLAVCEPSGGRLKPVRVLQGTN